MQKNHEDMQNPDVRHTSSEAFLSFTAAAASIRRSKASWPRHKPWLRG